jgi:predicted branched-subunit amino acid permease
MEQLKNRSNIIPGLIGLGATIISLLFFGADNVIIPAMALIMVAMLAMRRYDVHKH